MSDLTANAVRDRAETAADHCALSYDARLLRRRVLHSAGGLAFLVDLPKTISVEHGQAFELSDGRLIQIVAAEEELLEVRGADLVRLAWHIGNRHTPCEIAADRLLIQRDHVLRKMLEGLGAELAEVTAPFRPEGGAYGHGRTMGHSHDHRHGPDPEPDHQHDHAHKHDHSHAH